MASMIDQVIRNQELSAEISGQELAWPGSKAQASTLTAQIVPSAADANFDIDLEAAVNTLHGAQFTPIGKFTQNDETFASNLDFSLGCLYRFRHISGVACRVLLTG